MYCPSCGEQIPDDSSFCLHCGKPIPGADPTQAVTEWEYEDFIYTLPPNSGQFSMSNFTKREAALEFWHEHQHSFMKVLQEWINEGWKPVGDVGADNLVLTEASIAILPAYWEPTAFRVTMRRPKTEASAKETDTRPAIITIERKSRMWGSGRNFGAFVDGIKVGVIKNRSSQSIKVQPGKHIVYLKLDFNSSQEIELDLAPGEAAKLYCVIAGFWPMTRPKLSQIPF